MRRLLLVFSIALAAIPLLTSCITTQPFVAPVPSQPPVVDEARLKATVRYLSMTLFPRSFDQTEKLAAAGWYIRDAFTAAGAEVSVREFVVQGKKFRNIIARFGPDKGAVLVVGAHYDSHGGPASASGEDRGVGLETYTPGADDNASGVAGLIELAYLLAQHPPARPIELVAYTLEEPPYFRSEDMGSAVHVRSIDQASRPVELMIALEMIGYFSDAEGSQAFPFPGMGWYYPTRGNFIAIVSRIQDWAQTRRVKAAMAGATDLPVYSINTFPSVPGIDFSDHLNYWKKGIPAVMITDTAFNRNTEYHRRGDTHERLDYARMAKVVQGVYAFINPVPPHAGRAAADG
jgi:Zn-dependent M28 family amino/carboxypeptidase